MNTIGKILLGTATGLGVFLLLTTPEERLHLLGVVPALPSSPEGRPKIGPTPIPQAPDSKATSNLTVGSVVALKAGPGLFGEPDHINEPVTITAKELQRSPSPLLPNLWLFTGKSARTTAPIHFLERDISTIVSRA